MTETGIEVIIDNSRDHVLVQDPDLDHPITNTDTAMSVAAVAVHLAAPPPAVAAEIFITEICIAAEMVCHRFMVAMTNINREVKNTIHK